MREAQLHAAAAGDMGKRRWLRVRTAILLCITAELATAVPGCLGGGAHAGSPCAHDSAADIGTLGVAPQQYANHPWEGVPRGDGGRRMQASDTAPLRIRSDTSSFDLPDSTPELAYITGTLVHRAASRWEQALSVVPVDGPLFASRGCRTFNADGTCRAFAERPTCGNEDDPSHPTIPQQYLATEQECTAAGQCTTLQGGEGAMNADIVVLYTFVQTDSCGDETGGQVAEASWCQTDQHDRPTFARVNLCPSALVADVDHEEENVATIMHELAHALGFTSRSLPLFREADGTPRTPRDSADVAPLRVAPEYVVDIPCGSDGNTRPVAVPATSTLSFFDERGLGAPAGCRPYETPSACVAKVVTPEVVRMARLFFGCPHLNGAELENQPTSTCVPYGSHWEERILGDELLSGVASPRSFLSPLTLALFRDSGWYDVDYSEADPLYYGRSTGYQQGCSFAEDRCIDANGTPSGSPPHFCTGDAADLACATSRAGAGFCTIAEFSSALPVPYQYFSEPAVGGSPSTPDYCPFVKPHSQKICGFGALSPESNFQGETYGSGAMCFASDLRRVVGDRGLSNARVGCYTTECESAGAVRLLVDDVTEPLVCVSADQDLTAIGYDGSIRCVEPDILCSDGAKPTPEDADRPGSLSLAASSVTLPEGAAGTMIRVWVHRQAGILGAVSVTVATQDGSAVSGEHFTAAERTLHWEDGEAQPQALEVPITAWSMGKSFSAVLADASGADLGVDTTEFTFGVYEGSGQVGVDSSAQATGLAVELAVLACVFAIGAPEVIGVQRVAEG